MKVLFINHNSGTGSTGRICTDLAKRLIAEGNEAMIAYGRGEVPEQYQKISKRIGSRWSVYKHVIITRVFDRHGFSSKHSTRKFLKWADEYDPELLWLHNIHGYYINIEMLFDWIKSRPQMKVKWTLHDCWAFTGHCSYFTLVPCDQWKTQCLQCIQKKEYPASYLADNCRKNFYQKKALFMGVKDLTLITPSQWLANLVKQSFLRDYPVEVHYNTIDRTIFKPTESDFREKYGLQNKKIILGVANVWAERKGLRDFLELSKMLDDEYVIVLVGLTQKQIKDLPQSMLGLTRTNSPQELAAMYTMADIYANPSKEETFGMTTVEAIACGTKAIVYQDTACEEVVDTYGGTAIEPNVKALYEAIVALK